MSGERAAREGGAERASASERVRRAAAAALQRCIPGHALVMRQLSRGKRRTRLMVLPPLKKPRTSSGRLKNALL